MQLKDKITSKEDLVVAIGNHQDGGRFSNYEGRLYDSTRITPAWWAVREQARIQLGVYQMTDALVIVNNHAKVFAHVSQTDKTKVAFTPDKAFGERDAQLTMNFGKMVQRVIPFASDEYVKRLTEDHNADLSDEVEWITGPQIANVYANTSVASCMTSKSWQFHNPALAYDTPNIKMAVLRDPYGSINARCMVYEDGDDKRLIRSYGDGRLLKRLTRLGYEPGGWKGVKFRTIAEPIKDTGRVRVAIPYLDSLNGPSREHHCSVALIDGVLQGVTGEAYLALREAGFMPCVPSTVGYLDLVPVSSTGFIKKDCITGEDLNFLSDLTTAVFYKGSKGVTKPCNVSSDFVEARKLVYGVWEKLWMPVGETFNHGSLRLFNGHEERVQYGYYQLSKEFYDTEGWQYIRDAIKIEDKDGEPQYIKSEDAVRVYSKESGKTWTHRSKITKAYTRVADFGGVKWYVTPDVEVLRTPSKAKVVEGLHDIALGWKGWDYCRNLAVECNVFGAVYYCNRSERRSEEFKEFIKAKVREELDRSFGGSVGYNLQGKFQYLSSLQGSLGYVYPTPGNRYFTTSRYGVTNLQKMNLETFKEFLVSCEIAARGDIVQELLVARTRVVIAEMEATNGEEPVQQQPELEAPELVITERFSIAA